MTSGAAPRGLRGRRAECAVLDRVVADVGSGRGRALVMHGEAGVGKSALLQYAGSRASGCRVARAAGAESEMELPYAGLHQLCAPMLDVRDRLPEPQREALAVAFGDAAGPAPDKFLVGVAVLSLLAAVSEDQPLLCLIDDAQWLDSTSAQTLAFAARRLLAERAGVVFAIREAAAGPPWRGLPGLPVGGLPDEDARALLDSAVPGRLDEQVRDRIVAETRGNPLALLELPRGLTAAELAGGFGRPDARPLATKIERNFAQRVRALPAPAQTVLLTAAAEPLGDAGLLRRATRLLGLPTSAGTPAEAAGLIELGSRVRFRHPLVRTAVYRAASPAERRDVHQALARATDAGADPDRRAWHRANAADEPDEAVAAELVGSAERAQRRGGVAAAADFLRRATELTPDPATRATRALAAAEAEMRCGAFEIALKLLLTADEAADQGESSERHQATVGLMRAQIAFASGHDRAAPRLLLEAARRFEPLDAALARDTYRDAMGAASLAADFAESAGITEIARAIRAAPRPARPRPGDDLLDSLAVARTDGYATAAPLVLSALQAFRDANTTGDKSDKSATGARDEAAGAVGGGGDRSGKLPVGARDETVGAAGGVGDKSDKSAVGARDEAAGAAGGVSDESGKPAIATRDGADRAATGAGDEAGGAAAGAPYVAGRAAAGAPCVAGRAAAGAPHEGGGAGDQAGRTVEGAREQAGGADDQGWLWLAGLAAADVWDDETWSVVTARHVRVARAVGDLSALPLTLSSLACVEIFAGDFASAVSRVAEIQAIGEATGVALGPYGALTVAAWRGDAAGAEQLIEAGMADVVARGEASGILLIHWARSVLFNGLARYQEAIVEARAAATHPIHSALVYWALSELVEAAVRSGDREAAVEAYDRLATTARASGTDWALGVLTRAGALLADGGGDADALYRQAIERLGRTRIRIELARAHLLYGEWLRRENRRRAARGQLRIAYDMLTAAGAGAFAERARHELAAAGGPVTEVSARASDALTVQEAHIARLAGRGLTNPEIGAQLFLSPHTVEWHLRKVFTKLGITSRRQLRRSES
ncbi:helix-turn-helix transcriptional regulator [Paractinoplanes atraurantiacus]|uniref:Predicted ATPase n=1 Tax=Paractinoplanes atraurantiacus TaxID=1036182 RepID=A0A285I2T3_9ACTN|nr:LuxR family transcriptional regulator [Actinoplanes atraurantiacus]SNY42254.1 Predicted ATPase [Actinoplanes atraurantiacus]